MPVLPSTRMRWPVLMVLVPNAVPVTAGRPYSRQTMAAWAHHPADVGHGRPDLAEDRAPSDGAVSGRHQDLARLQLGDPVGRAG